MASNAAPQVPLSGEPSARDAALQRPWRKWSRLSSGLDEADAFLGRTGHDRGPWLAVAFAAGIAVWFVLPTHFEWIGAIVGGIVLAICGTFVGRTHDAWPHMRLAAICLGLAFAFGIAVIWTRSGLIGATPIARPATGTFDARVLERIEQPAEGRTRLVLAMRDPDSGHPVKVRVNVPHEWDSPAFSKGAVIRVPARLMPPAPPMLPGAYDFARAAWFQGFAATGSVTGQVAIVTAAPPGHGPSAIQGMLSRHVRGQIAGSPGAIAAAFASGDRGAIDRADEDAMRDAGLTHLLSISGLHVSAIVAGVYVLAIRLLAVWPWLALRVRLPVVAAGAAALAGIGYTLLTGAEVPTIRSCAAAVMVLIALALGREPLSLRMVAVAVIFVLLLWPESLAGPSFQMSFTAVIAIVALHGCAPVRAFLAPREEGWLGWGMRGLAMLLITGLVIEIALMPIVVFHFHKAGVYGAFANVIAIPLTTFVSMPLIALALLLDMAGLGAPVWWLAGKSLELLLAIAHWTAAQPGAVTRMPYMPVTALALCVAGGLWLALWRGRVRLVGLLPVAAGGVLTVLAPAPDVLISGDGRQVGLRGADGRLLILRDSRSDFVRENLSELSGIEGNPVPLAEWPGAECSRDFCVVSLKREGREWYILMARSRELVEERALAAACERADIVVADRYLPRSCRPRWIRADRHMLSRSGGLALSLDPPRLRTVAQDHGAHGWWRGNDRPKRKSAPPLIQ